MLGQLSIGSDGQLRDKVQTAIDRLKAFEPQDGYWQAMSFGKDSQAVHLLLCMAKVKFESHYSVTSVDPPELLQFGKKQYPDTKWDRRYDENGKPITMWSLIQKKLMPPTRLVRYCCEELKEAHGEGRVTVTGVRWAESANRKANQAIVTFPSRSKKLKQEMENLGANFTKTNRGGGAKRRQRYEQTRRRALLSHIQNDGKSDCGLDNGGCLGISERRRDAAL